MKLASYSIFCNCVSFLLQRRPGVYVLSLLVLTLFAPAGFAQSSIAPSFGAPSSNTAGISSPDILTTAVADFNGDGIQDLATTNFVESAVSISIGNGDGTFQAPIPYTVGSLPLGIVTGDFNGDGKIDIAVPNAGDSTVSILLNLGNGIFPSSPSSTYSVGSTPIDIATADLNKDGHLDLIVTNIADGTLSVLLGSGSGTFSASSPVVIGRSALGPVLGDLNGDGYPDVVVHNSSENTIGILFNDGSGKLLPQINYAAGAQPYGVSLGDFNGDGWLDVAVASVGGNTVGILLNDKSGNLLPEVGYAAGSQALSVVAKDFNQDGILDLVVTHLADSTLNLLLGRGDGTFSAPTVLSAGAKPWVVASADLNGDGLPDLVLTNTGGTSNIITTLLQMPSSSTDVTTYHYNNARNGLNTNETVLSPANVTSSTFGKLTILGVDGKVDAEPLYLSNLNINGRVRNVVYVVSEHDSIYAFDADSYTKLWQVSALGPNETTSDNHGCNQITPEIGITSTPVIDRSAGPNGTIFIVAMSKDPGGATHQRLHALDITNGHEVSGSPTEITGTYPGTGDNNDGHGNVLFDPAQYAERAGLLLMNNTLYLGWTSHCDTRPYTGWVMAYNENTLQQTSILNLTPNGNEGAIWMSGAGMAGDSSGNVYLLDANGETETTFDANGFPSGQDYGNAILKLSTTGGKLAVADFFEPYNTVAESDADVDLGSGGALLLPDQVDANGVVRHLLVGAGKDGGIYVADRDNLGKFKADGNNSNIYQWLGGAVQSGVWSMPAYFNQTIYYGDIFGSIQAFPISNARLATASSSRTSTLFSYPSATPSVSANGTKNGIVWALESNVDSPGVLHAYDANNLATEFYNSNQAPAGRDSYGAGNKFITPVIVNGKVFVPTPSGVAVFGLLNQ